jgi:RNA polymerase sigma-70 factor (sigma-E family)
MDDIPDPAAFVSARGNAMLRLAWLLTGDGPAAEDLVQEALARVLPRWSAISAGKHEGYVRASIRTTWIDTLRRRAARVQLDVVPDVPEVPATGDGPADADLRVSLRAALATLTPRQRTVLVLRFYEDLSEADTARAMKCSVGTVKSQTRVALDRLRERAPELEFLLREEVAR